MMLFSSAVVLLLASLAAQAQGSAEAPLAEETGSLRFVENLGQWDCDSLFVGRSGSLMVRAERGGFLLQRHDGKSGHLIRVGLGTDAIPQGVAKLAGVHSFFRGNDPAAWEGGVPSYGTVLYQEVRKGVDLALRGGEDGVVLELRAGSEEELRSFKLTIQGSSGVSERLDGSLEFGTSLGLVRLAAPHVVLGSGRPFVGSFRLLATGAVGVVPMRGMPRANTEAAVAGAGAGPVWSTYIGSSMGLSDAAWDTVLDDAGNLYLSGQTEGLDFPVTPGAFVVQGNDRDVVVLKLAASGSELIYSAIIGGRFDEAGYGIVLDPSGRVVVGGYTFSKNFPSTASAFDQTNDAFQDTGFVLMLETDGGALVFSTFLGGTVADRISGVALAADGEPIVVGRTTSVDLPATPGAFQGGYQGVGDAFAARLSSDGSSLRWLTYLGGDRTDEAADVAVATDGTLTITGWTNSKDFPTTPGAYDETFNGNVLARNAFVTRLTGSGALVWSTYLGAPGITYGRCVALNAMGDVWIAGETNALKFPVTPGVYDGVFNDGVSLLDDVFLARLNSTGSTLVFATYFGDVGPDFGRDLRVDPSGVATLVGFSFLMPITKGAWSNTGVGFEDMFVSRFNPQGTKLLYSTMVGGSFIDQGITVAVDGIGTVTVAGASLSSDYPTTPGAYDETYNGGQSDMMVTRLDFLPTGVVRYGSSPPTCLGPLALGVLEMPEAGGAGFGFYLSTAPPNAVGVVALSMGAAQQPLSLGGADVWLSPSSVFSLLPAASDAGGYSEVALPLPAGTAGLVVNAQAVMINTAGCGGLGTLSASNALELTVQ